jgi:hypothetical protein
VSVRLGFEVSRVVAVRAMHAENAELVFTSTPTLVNFTGLTSCFGPSLTISNRDFHSNCWLDLKIMGQLCEFQVTAGEFLTNFTVPVLDHSDFMMLLKK